MYHRVRCVACFNGKCNLHIKLYKFQYILEKKHRFLRFAGEASNHVHVLGFKFLGMSINYDSSSIF